MTYNIKNPVALIFFILVLCKLYSQDTLINSESYTDGLLFEATFSEDSIISSYVFEEDSLQIGIRVDSILSRADDSIAESLYMCFLMDNLCSELVKARIEFTTDTTALNKYGYSPDSIPVWSDSVYEARIHELDMQTPIDLFFNKDIKQYINVYAVKRRELTSKVLGLAEIYFPIFEETLDKYNMPYELKYLPIVESALNPTAGSRAGAKGLWQFMYGTGKLYGLHQTSYVDDRFDPYKSTEAACLHLKDLYNIYDDWLLALAAYNSGTGNVNKAIRRAGGKKNYWLVWPYLPRETRGYFPAFSAIIYIMNYAAEHNIYPMEPLLLAHETDTVVVHEVVSFEQINEVIGTDMELIKFLNPAYKLGVIPATEKNPYVIKLPTQDILKFVSDPQKVFCYKTKSGITREKMLQDIKKASEAQIHVVKKGETLGYIAKTYNTTVSKLMTWNNMKNTSLKIGQKIIVYPGNK